MSYTLLLEKSISGEISKERLAIPSGERRNPGNLTAGIRARDERTGIHYRCECLRPDGKHESVCFLNLV